MKRNNTVEPKKPTSGDMQLKIQHQEQRFEGPIPPPAVLQGYEQILPGAAERILRMAEQQAAHRHSLELKSINANISGADRQLELADKQLKAVYASDKLGQWLGFAVSMCCLGGGIYLGVIGQPWLAGVLASLPIASVKATTRKCAPRGDGRAQKEKPTDNASGFYFFKRTNTFVVGLPNFRCP